MPAWGLLLPMVPALRAFVSQEKPPVRDLRPGLERKYRVTVTHLEDRSSYRLAVRVVEAKSDKGKKGELSLDLRLTDYRAVIDGRKASTRTLGGGPMALTANGLPGELSIAGPQGPIWLPLLSLYLPSAGEFDVPKVDVGGGIAMTGRGRYGKTAEIDAVLTRQGEEIGKVALATTLDPQGWPLKAEGSLVSAEGTYAFTLQR